MQKEQKLIMKVQHNKQTKMFWSYLPTKMARILGLEKGDTIEFLKIDDKSTPEFLVKKTEETK